MAESKVRINKFMGFFGKNKITLDQSAEGLADMVFKSTTETSLQAYKTLIKDMKESEEIDPRQKREVLVFEMLAATRAISKVFTNPSEAKELLDKFHSKIYGMVSDVEDEQVDFEKFINERYQTYYQILASKEENMMFHFGKQFADYFLNKDIMGTGLALIMCSAEIFVSNIENLSNFMKEILIKFELKK